MLESDIRAEQLDHKLLQLVPPVDAEVTPLAQRSAFRSLWAHSSVGGTPSLMDMRSHSRHSIQRLIFTDSV